MSVKSIALATAAFCTLIASAAAQDLANPGACPERPICPHCPPGNTQEGQASNGQNVQGQNAQAGFDYYIRLPGVEGESGRSPPPPPPPPPSNAPTAQLGVQARGASAAAAAGGRDDDHRQGIDIYSSNAQPSAAETEHDRHVFVNNANPEQSAAVGGASGGVWKTSDGAAALTDGLLIIRSMAGLTGTAAASAPGVEPDELVTQQAQTQQAPGVEPDELASQQAHQAGLLLPAVQKVREAAARTNGAAPGVEPDELVTQQAQQQGRSGTGTLTLSSGGQAATPAPSAAPVAAAAEEQQPRRRRGAFSLSIGGISVSNSGVSVAAGDVNGDSQSAGRQHRPIRVTRETDHGSGAPARTVQRAAPQARPAPSRR